MEGGGPLPTPALIEQIELPEDVNPKLLEFSMDLALQEDQRFDEVGSAGVISWFLQRLEPDPVLETPVYLRYRETDYDRTALTGEMLALERDLEDELSPHPVSTVQMDKVDIFFDIKDIDKLSELLKLTPVEKKTDDRLELNSLLGLKAKGFWYYSLIFNFKTQFRTGYKYEKDQNEKEIRTEFTDFMSPANILLGPGMLWKKMRISRLTLLR